jgi:RNA-directed DNA polymerase
VSPLRWVNERAVRDKRARFTALLHHITIARLEEAFWRLRRNASAGVDGETVASYGQNLRENLERLAERVHTGRYRPKPVRRVYIPKADGEKRPLGIPALEDKLLQGAVAEVLGAIYEADFLGFSYGFRPGRSPHQALDALHRAVMTQCVNWVLDADIRKFFDSVDHEWLLKIVAHRVGDPRILHLIQMWLKAGALEGGQWQATEEGTPQGSAISPLLANIFLHYVLDLWVHHWRQHVARGKVSVVRYCDDFVMCFQYRDDAERMRNDLKERLGKFHLELKAEKTRLIEFGRFPMLNRARLGKRRPETFAFLGFTHYCGWTKDGRFIMKRKTDHRRTTRKLKELRREAYRRIHLPLTVQHAWLRAVLRGHYGYYGVTGNRRSMAGFYFEVLKLWYRSLRRRGQRHPLSWERYSLLLQRFPLPQPLVTHSMLVRTA